MRERGREMKERMRERESERASETHQTTLVTRVEQGAVSCCACADIALEIKMGKKPPSRAGVRGTHPDVDERGK